MARKSKRPKAQPVRRKASRRIVRKAAPRRAKPIRKAVRKSALRVVPRPAKRTFRNRFAKFYWLHRDDFNARRKRLYQARKRSKECVKCGERRVGKSIFCTAHLRRSRIYNRRARAR